MSPSRKRTSARLAKGLPPDQKKHRANNALVTPNTTAPGGSYIAQKSVYAISCKTELNRDECVVKGEPEEEPCDPNRINGEPSDWPNVSSEKDCGAQSFSLEKYCKIKNEQEEGDIGQDTSQDLVGSSIKVDPDEPLQDQKLILKDQEANQNFAAETEDKKVRPFTCFCGKSYTCTSHLNRHRKSHRPEDQYSAVYNSRFNEEQTVAQHSQISEEKTADRCFTCQCGKQYTRRSNLKRHQNSCSEQSLVETIDNSTVTYQNVEDPEEKVKPYVCACGKSYTSSSHLYRHQRTHAEFNSQAEKHYICECGKSYSCSSHLYRHQRSHAEEKVLEGQKVAEDLEKRIKPYVCFCGKSYTCSSHLYRHQKVHHVDNIPVRENKEVEDTETDKRYKCHCGKSYTSSSHLYRHQRTHKVPEFTPESNDLDHDNQEVDLDDCRQKPYKCECGKSFILSFSLLLHKKIHCRWKHPTDSPDH